MKHIKSIILTILTALLTLPASAQDFEYQGLWYTVIDPEAKKCQTKEGPSEDQPGNRFEGDLVIPELVYEGESEFSVVGIGERGFRGCEGISSVALPNSIEFIADEAFWDCNNMESVRMSQSLLSIGSNSFRGCRLLTEVNLPESLLTIGGWAFSSCDRLERINLPESMTHLGDAAFADCIALKSIAIPRLITRIGDVTFHMCNSLSSISLHDRLEVIGGYAFEYCPVTEIDLPNSLMTVGHFAFCGTGLSKVDIPESVTHIGGNAFFWCENLTEIHLPASLEEIGSEAFGRNDKIYRITYDAASPLRTDEALFSERVYQRGELMMPNAALADIQATECWNQFCHIVAKDGEIQITPPLYAGDDFEYQGLWYTVIDPDAKTCKTREGHAGDDNDSATAGNDCQGAVSIPEKVSYGNDEYTVTEIGQYSFSGCVGITAMEIPGTVTSIGDYAFSECINLTSVNVPDAVTSIGSSAFRACAKLSSVTLPGNLTSLQDMTFALCSSLTSVDLPETLSEIGDMAFAACSSLTSIEIPNSVSKIGIQAFGNCTALTSIHLPDALTSVSDALLMGCRSLNSIEIPENVTSIGRSSFERCSSVSGIRIPESVISIGQRAFRDCTGLISVNIPQSLTSIDPQVFYGCTGLTSIDIPEGVASIGEGAFMECSGLTSVAIPGSVTSIGGRAFYQCENIEAVSFAASTPVSANEDIFNDSVYQDATLNMPNAILADIRSTVPWSLFDHAIAADGSIGFVNAGDEFEYEGIWYTVLDAEEKTVKTKNGSQSEPGNPVEGELVIPSIVSDGVNYYTVTEIGMYSFIFCENMTSLTLPETLVSIQECGFAFCRKLNSVDFPISLEFIGNGAFSDTPLISVVIPDSVRVVEHYAFWGNDALKSVVFPANIEVIGECSFHGSVNLRSVTYLASEPRAFDGGIFDTVEYESDAYTDGTLYMPNASLASIQAVEPWNRFRHIIAKDGELNLLPPLKNGDEIEHEGIVYTVIDSEAKTVKTRDGQDGDNPGNHYEGALTIPATVTYDNNEYTVVEIGHHGFCSLSGLTSVAMSATVVKLGEAAFCNCENLSSIELSDSLTEVEGFVFDSCVSLTSVVLPEGLEYVGERMFAHCHSLTSVILPSTIKEIRGWAFGDADLTSINLPEGLEIIGGEALTQNRNLASIAFPNSLTEIWDRAFSSCAFTSLILPESLQIIGDGAFYHCYDLESIVLPASLSSIGMDAFGEGDDKLFYVTYNAEDPIEADPGIFLNRGDFYETATLTMPNATLKAIQAIAPWNLFLHIVAKDGELPPSLNAGDDFEYDDIWYTVIDPATKTCRTKAGDGGAYGWQMTAGNKVEGDIVIPSTVILNADEYTVIEIGDYGFSSQGNLISVTFPESLINIGQFAFYQCYGLTSLTLPNSVEYIGNHAFRECENISDVKFSESLKFIGAAAFRSGAFRSLEFPESLSEIREDAFGYCYNLESIKFPSAMENIGGSAFACCTALTSVVLPEEMESVDSYIFDGCTGITQVILPKSPSVIDTGAFRGCSALTSIELPSSITKFGYWVFEGFSGLSEITYLAEVPVSSGVDMFDGTVYERAILNMPNAVITDVKAIQPWSLFHYIIAKDGNSGFVSAGDDFEYEGVWYTIIDPESKTVRTKENGNVNCDEEIVVPAEVSDGQEFYTVAEIGQDSFRGAQAILSVSLPASIETIGQDAFADCPRLASIVWTRRERLADRVVEEINNPNLLLYVEDIQYAPEGMTANVVADGVCDRLVLTQGYPFKPLYDFTANHSSLTKEFTQTTPLDGCAGWETIVLPFDATSVRVNDARGALTPFPLVTDIDTQYPYWIYQADSEGEWALASGIQAGVPYLVAMPNNPEYEVRYNIDGPVTFSNPNTTRIMAETASPYAVTWASGRQFRSLWLPLDGEQATDALGLNANVSGFTDEDGETLAPGSAFVVGITPKPLEAYVTRNGSARAFRISGAQSGVLTVPDGQGLKMTQDGGLLFLQSDTDRIIQVYSISGAAIRRIALKAGAPAVIDDLPQGVCIIAGRKVMIR